MADGADLSFPWKQFETMLKEIGGEATTRQLVRSMKKAGDAYEAEMVALAPHKHGYLENSSTVRTQRSGNSIRTEIAFGTNYAAQVHELPADRRGPQTRRKPATKFGEAGPKFVERVLRGMDFEAIIGKAYREVLSEAARRSRRRR